MLAINVTRDAVLADRLEWAGTSETRKRGLLGRTHLEDGEGIYIVPCQWVHMFGMKFAIDVAFVAADGRVVAVQAGLKPNRLSKLVIRADGVLELPVGTLARTGTERGDRVEFRDDEDETPPEHQET